MQCPQCQHANRDTAKFCEECGARLIHRCFHCGYDVRPRAKFCEECGAFLSRLLPDTSLYTAHHPIDSESRFQALLPAVIGLLQRDRRVTYRTLKYIFGIEDGLLLEICEELLLRQVAIDEGGKVLVWRGAPPPTAYPTATVPTPSESAESTGLLSPITPAVSAPVTPIDTEANGPTTSPETLPTDVQSDELAAVSEPVRSSYEAERRQLTVMFCDLVGSTDLSGKLDPEDLREVVRAYQEMAAEVIERYEGHIAQYLGDGLMVYFGWPQAHEDDARRAVHTGIEIIEAIGRLNIRLEADYDIQLAVRIGIHTGLVVVGEMGGGVGTNTSLWGRHQILRPASKGLPLPTR